MTTPWYVLYCTSALKARDELLEAKLEVFLPTYQRLSRLRHLRSRQRKLETVPLLEGYIFVRTDLDGLYEARACESVVRVLGSGGMPRPVLESQVVKLQDLVASGEWDDVLTTTKTPIRRRGKARLRGIRSRGLESLKLCLAEAEAQDIAEAA